MAGRKKDENEVKKNMLNCKVSNDELEEFRNILSISECSSMSDLIRTSIKHYGASIKEGSI